MNIISSGIDSYSEQICEISLRARKEEDLEKSLTNHLQPWTSAEFQFKYDKDKDFYTFTEIETITSMLEETQISISTILTNRYIGDLYNLVDK